MPDRIWNAAEYTRLSRDDGDKAESNSITSQKEIIRDYVRRHPEFVIVKEYADDGYSGVNFERPGFKQMMEDMIKKTDFQAKRAKYTKQSGEYRRGIGLITCYRGAGLGSETIDAGGAWISAQIDGSFLINTGLAENGQGLRKCSMHYIRYDVLYAYVLSRLQYWSQQAQQDEDKLLKRLLNASDKERSSAREKQASELKKAEKRKAEVDGLFAKMYEDWAAGRITEYNFNMLSEKYQGEQKELDEKIQQLHEAMEAVAQTAVDAEKWVGLMRQYVNPTELTAELLNTLIEKIFVHEAVKGEDGSREQEVEIFYRFIGKID